MKNATWYSCLTLVFVLLVSPSTSANKDTQGRFFAEDIRWAPAASGAPDSASQHRKDITAKSSWVDALAYGVSGAQAAIAAAISAIGPDQKTLYLPPATWAITSDLTIPSNVTLKIETGAILSIAASQTLTIQGAIEAGPYQIFSCIGTGKVAGQARVSQVYPQWWGAAGDANPATGTGSDDSAAFEAASMFCSQLQGGGKILLPPPSSAYKCNFTLRGGVVVESPGSNAKLIPASDAPVIKSPAEDDLIWAGIRNLYIDGTWNKTTATAADGILFKQTKAKKYTDQIFLENVKIWNMGGQGLALESNYVANGNFTQGINAKLLYAHANTGPGLYIKGGNFQNRFENCTFTNNGNSSASDTVNQDKNNLVILADNSDIPMQTTFVNGVIHPNGNNCAVYTDGFQDLAFMNVDLEQIPTYGIVCAGSGVKYNFSMRGGQFLNNQNGITFLYFKTATFGINIDNVRMTAAPGKTVTHGIYFADGQTFTEPRLSNLIFEQITTHIRYPNDFNVLTIGKFKDIWLSRPGLIRVRREPEGTTTIKYIHFNDIMTPRDGEIAIIQRDSSETGEIYIQQDSPDRTNSVMLRSSTDTITLRSAGDLAIFTYNSTNKRWWEVARNQVYRSFNSNPTNNVLPEYVGQLCFDSSGTKKWYIATGMTLADWSAINN